MRIRINVFSFLFTLHFLLVSLCKVHGFVDLIFVETSSPALFIGCVCIGGVCRSFFMSWHIFSLFGKISYIPYLVYVVFLKFHSIFVEYFPCESLWNPVGIHAFCFWFQGHLEMIDWIAKERKKVENKWRRTFALCKQLKCIENILV